MVRVGFRHTFSPDSIVLASVIYQNSQATVTDDQLAIPVTYAHPRASPKRR